MDASRRRITQIMKNQIKAQTDNKIIKKASFALAALSAINQVTIFYIVQKETRKKIQNTTSNWLGEHVQSTSKQCSTLFIIIPSKLNKQQMQIRRAKSNWKTSSETID